MIHLSKSTSLSVSCASTRILTPLLRRTNIASLPLKALVNPGSVALHADIAARLSPWKESGAPRSITAEECPGYHSQDIKVIGKKTSASRRMTSRDQASDYRRGEGRLPMQQVQPQILGSRWTHTITWALRNQLDDANHVPSLHCSQSASKDCRIS